MKKSILFLFTTLLIFGCTQDSNETTNEQSYASLIKANSAKIVKSDELKNHFNSNNSQDLTANSNLLITQEQLDDYLELLDVPQEYKNSLSLSEVNNVVDQLIEYNNTGNIEASIMNTTLSENTQQTVVQLIEDGREQNVQDLIAFDGLSVNEQETLLVVNDLTNDYFSPSAGLAQASMMPNFLAFFQSGNCTGSGPNGSGPIDCGVAFGLLGATIGGSCCGLGGAIIGGVVGFIVGEIIDKQ